MRESRHTVLPAPGIWAALELFRAAVSRCNIHGSETFTQANAVRLRLQRAGIHAAGPFRFGVRARSSFSFLPALLVPHGPPEGPKVLLPALGLVKATLTTCAFGSFPRTFTKSRHSLHHPFLLDDDVGSDTPGSSQILSLDSDRLLVNTGNL